MCIPPRSDILPQDPPNYTLKAQETSLRIPRLSLPAGFEKEQAPFNQVTLIAEKEAKPLKTVKDFRIQAFFQATLDSNSLQFVEALQSLDRPEEAGKAVTNLLKHFALKQRGKAYFFILENLRQLFPQINQYVIQVDGTGGKIDVLSSLAIKMRIQNLQNKGKIKFPCILCENYEELQVKLKKFAASSETKTLFIVRNQNLGASPPVMHVSPIFAEKTSTSTRFLITDSLGGDNLFGGLISHKLYQLLKKETFENYQIFSYNGPARQIAQTNCPIFAILDAMQLSSLKDPFDFCEKIVADHPERSFDRRVMYINLLPSEMMKYAQNSSSFVEETFLKYERNAIALVVKNSFAQVKQEKK